MGAGGVPVRAGPYARGDPAPGLRGFPGGQPVVGLLSAGVEKLPLTKDQDPVMAHIAGAAPVPQGLGGELVQTVDRSQPGSQMAGLVQGGWQTGKEYEQPVHGKGIPADGSLRVFVY